MEIALLAVLLLAITWAARKKWKVLETKIDQVSSTQEKIHILTNSGMRAALVATVAFARSDAVSKKRLAEITKADADIQASQFAEGAIKEAQALVDLHDAKL